MAERGSLIRKSQVKREWLLRCRDARRDGLAVCAIGVSAGTVEVYGPEDELAFSLEGSEIAEFRAALNAAIAQAERDLRGRHRVCDLTLGTESA